jgi:hypothetical protein
MIIDVVFLLVYPQLLMSKAATAAVKFLILVTRLSCQRMADQRRACVLFGRAFDAALLFMAVFVGSLIRAQPPDPPLSASVLALTALIWTLAPIYMRFSALESEHRLVAVLLCVGGAYALPPWSVIGRPSEPLFLFSALMLGELIGFVRKTMRQKHPSKHRA